MIGFVNVKAMLPPFAFSLKWNDKKNTVIKIITIIDNEIKRENVCFNGNTLSLSMTHNLEVLSEFVTTFVFIIYIEKHISKIIMTQ